MTSAGDASAGRAGDEASVAEVQERYARFARDEASGRSDLYADWAAGVAAESATAAILARIPATRRQPPLVFAVTRLLGAPEGGFAEWSRWLAAHDDDVVREAGRRSLQTNEPLRCAALLPALSRIDGPIALLEVGASAGLCLIPDRYSYRYLGDDDRALNPLGGESTVMLESRLEGGPALRLPDIAWRAGIDLEPLDPASEDDRRFLETLVWPGETGRAERIRAALGLAAEEALRIVRGDAADPAVLRALAAEAPAGVTLVITTPGVLPHIPRSGRERLIRTIGDLDARWISIDPPGLHDAWDPPVDAASWGGFVLGLDGRPLAAVDPLGAFVEWRA